ncbi:hypothetical protein [Ligilactobacillus equi]|uniref:Molybdate transporter ATP-binding protein n=1 Tax=Ligilactobacillus equi DPC 6820 TaxID=1392007 RepID=V7HW30_9LACO|nr:hypothetical protein [Ligilactobacillus equi]ETA73475.1 molybdate transporter ATP-binding protein [Ligilactobacillus equi DPC 6820]
MGIYKSKEEQDLDKKLIQVNKNLHQLLETAENEGTLTDLDTGKVSGAQDIYLELAQEAIQASRLMREWDALIEQDDDVA